MNTIPTKLHTIPKWLLNCRGLGGPLRSPRRYKKPDRPSKGVGSPDVRTWIVLSKEAVLDAADTALKALEAILNSPVRAGCQS